LRENNIFFFKEFYVIRLEQIQIDTFTHTVRQENNNNYLFTDNLTVLLTVLSMRGKIHIQCKFVMYTTLYVIYR
jgi:hypothetical protein